MKIARFNFSTLSALAFVILMYALFASVFTVGKYTLQYCSPYFLTATRMLLAAGMLLPFCRQFAISRKTFPLILALAFFNVFLTNAFEFWALQYMLSAKASLIYSFSPLFAILIGFIFFRERISKRKWLGLLIGFAGFIPFTLKPGELGHFGLPEWAVTVSSLTSVIGWLTMKRLMEEHRFSFVSANMYSFALAALFSFVTAWLIEKPPYVTQPMPFVLGLLYITIVHNVICYNIYAYSLRRFSVALMAFAGFTNPMFTAIYGYFFLGEAVNLVFFLSLIFVFFGITLYSLEERKRAENLHG